MSSSHVDTRSPEARHVSVTDDSLVVDLVDGRTISVPIGWYPRLAHATSEERQTWELIGRGEGIHWPALDEDVSIEALLRGFASGESNASLQKWLKGREGTR